MVGKFCRTSWPAACLLLAIVAGCNDAGPARAAIEGQVTVGGQPLAAGRILFMPIAPTEGPAASAAIVNGRYRVERWAGPIVGRNRALIEASLDLGFPLDDDEAFTRQAGQPLVLPSSIPPEFNRDSQLTVEVKPGEENRFDVTIGAAAAPSAHSAD